MRRPTQFEYNLMKKSASVDFPEPAAGVGPAQGLRSACMHNYSQLNLMSEQRLCEADGYDVGRILRVWNVSLAPSSLNYCLGVSRACDLSTLMLWCSDAALDGITFAPPNNIRLGTYKNIEITQKQKKAKKINFNLRIFTWTYKKENRNKNPL